MKDYKNLINSGKIPEHIAIIMDGNGRWAKKKSLSRSEGHKKGADAIEPVLDAAIELNVKAISLYAFSIENWLRPSMEVSYLWKLLNNYFIKNLERIKKKEIKVMHSGSRKRLLKSTRNAIDNAVEETKKNKKIILNFCINYGSRQEIVEAVNKWHENSKPGEKFTSKKLEKNLYTRGLPEVDLLIRTSDEYRISNFLLWQMAYAEFVFMDVLWPDFKPSNLYSAIYQYQQRDRRFGNI